MRPARCTVRKSKVGTPLRCENVKVRQGQRTPDPRHPDDRAMDSVVYTYRCPHCLEESQSTVYPYLFADMFSA